MTYRDIIERNSDNPNIKIKWWTRYAFHYTDVTNAIGILTSGHLYSRKDAIKAGMMKCDNASRQVINMTKAETFLNARFYFRPLTPTQFHNEGYKHPNLRFQTEDNANVPVPIFFLFDLEKLLSQPDTKFSEMTQAGHGSPYYSTPNDFSNLNFSKIYSEGPMSDSDEKYYRHAEIAYPKGYPIDDSLRFICCRNDIEKMTLLNYLRDKDNEIYKKYKRMIKVVKQELYLKNGLFITDCFYYQKDAYIQFSNTYEKKRYIEYQSSNSTETIELSKIIARADFEWIGNGEGNGLLHRVSLTFPVDYEEGGAYLFEDIGHIPNATLLRIKVFIEEQPICYFEQSLSESEML